jgi:hypothetical protein
MRALVVLVAVAGATLAVALPAAADPPTVRHIQDVFVDINPCTGLEHTVTIDVTAYESRPGVHHATRVITTSSGFTGRGEEVGVFHDNTFLINDILVNNDTGERIHAHAVLITNPATGELQVFRFALTCIPPGTN